MKLTFCCACLSTDNLHHHHLMPKSLGGSDDDTNLITLCRECHRVIHGLRDRRLYTQRELQAEGIAKAKSEGRMIGRQQSPETVKKCVRALELIASSKITMEEAAKAVGVGVATLYRYKKGA